MAEFRLGLYDPTNHRDRVRYIGRLHKDTDYDRRVMEIIHVDDFTTDEMAAGSGEQSVDDVRPVRVSNA